MRKWMLLILICLTGCQQKQISQLGSESADAISAPDTMPTPATDIAEGQEESEDNQLRIKQWLDEINRSAPGVNWRELERDSARNLSLTRSTILNLTGTESFANGQVSGTWHEIGSNNQAGSVHKVRYVPETDTIYAFGGELVNTIGGRSLWKGNRDGTGWTLLNDDYFLEPSILEAFFPTGSNQIRLISAAHKYPMYSDDEGATWVDAITDLTGTGGSQISMHRVPWDNDTILYLCRQNQSVRLYMSTDAGVSYSEILVTATTHTNRASLWVPTSGTKAYVMVGGHTIHSIDSNGSVANVSITDLPQQSEVTLTGAIADGTTTMYVLINDSEVYVSNDEGANWSFVSSTPVSAWSVGIRCNPTDPTKLFVGAVETYYSHDSGASWTRANRWQDYYSNTDDLHADIMDFQYGETTESQQFLMIANHGGLHITYDNMLTTENISESGLNVAQYYDVLTNQGLPDYVYAGSQDQGMQLADSATTGGVQDFEQTLSGDYASLTLTNNGLSFWNQYPGGAFRYYHDATTLNQGTSGFYGLGGSDRPTWMIPTSPIKSDPVGNAFLAAGGNISGGPGSYLVKLTAATSPPHNITPFQYDFDFRAAAGGSTKISAIEQPAHDPDLFYVTTENGRFFRSTDGGSTWVMTVGHEGPTDNWIYNACILASNVDTQTVWTGGAGFGVPAVYRSVDGGDTFTPMSDGLPNCRVAEIVANEDESLLFAATSVGPFVFVAADQQWYPLLGSNTPLSWYTAVEYLQATNTVRFATFGRGVWDFQLNIETTFAPDSFTTFRGVNVDGDLAEVQSSDDSYLRHQPGFTLNSSEAPVWLIFDATVNGTSPSSLTLNIEGNANTPGLTQSVEAFDWTAGSYVEVGNEASAFNNDSVQTIDLTSGIQQWIDNQTSAVRTRLGWRQTGFVILFPWTASLDHIEWETN